MNESLKRYITSLPGHTEVDQKSLDDLCAEVTARVVPEIDRKLQEQRQLNAVSRVISVMRPLLDRH